MMQAWLIRRIVQEVVPPVIDAVMGRLRQRGTPTEVRQDDQMQNLSQQTEARLAAMESELRAQESRYSSALDGLARKLDRLAFWNTVLLVWAAAATLALIYLLAR